MKPNSNVAVCLLRVADIDQSKPNGRIGLQVAGHGTRKLQYGGMAEWRLTRYMIVIAALPGTKEALSVLRIILDPSENHPELSRNAPMADLRLG